MKDFISKPEQFNKIEFWAATTIYVFALFFLITNALSGGHYIQGNIPSENPRTPFDYYFISKAIRYTVLYLSYLLLNFRIVPQLLKKEMLWLNITLTIVLFLLIGLIFGSLSTFLKYQFFKDAYQSPSAHRILFQKGFLYALWLLSLFAFYTVIKYVGLSLLNRSEDIHAKYQFVTPGGLFAFVIWMTIMFFLFTGDANRYAIAAWGIIVPFGILFYWFSLYILIPRAVKRKHPFRSLLMICIVILFISALPVLLIALLFTQDDDPAGIIATFNGFIHLFITLPLSWIVYKRLQQGNEVVLGLKRELGQSNANFDFLRSQINPHFLFNALNTIYGTAIQEKAERTSEGVEKLGDMMRFMLQENMQDKIALSREIDYLNNYISLQKLRTDPNPTIRIEAEIESVIKPVQIAPMLLIPFVENAFKHGISFREPSHIKITLEVKEGVLYFDVFNIKHFKSENDPEKGKSGIGLNNVRQRLQLLYPSKHDLVIRDTKKDFFVHLTIQLT
ncbi:MAG TPA: histidine kinase [Flavisolibacter sp.]|nr:histidine kinase [Flavisolibacter sp.]